MWMAGTRDTTPSSDITLTHFKDSNLTVLQLEYSLDRVGQEYPEDCWAYGSNGVGSKVVQKKEMT